MSKRKNVDEHNKTHEKHLKTETITIEQLFDACKSNDIRCVKDAIQQKLDLNETDEVGWTPLHVACLEGHLEIVKELVGQHVDMKKSDLGGTPFYVACILCHSDIVQELSSIVKLEEIKENLFKHISEITNILLERIQKEYHIPIIHLLFGQQQPDSPLSVLHRDVLQDISKTIKEKIFL